MTIPASDERHKLILDGGKKTCPTCGVSQQVLVQCPVCGEWVDYLHDLTYTTPGHDTILHTGKVLRVGGSLKTLFTGCYTCWNTHAAKIKRALAAYSDN